MNKTKTINWEILKQFKNKKNDMQKAEEKREKETAERAEGTGMLLLTMGQNRSFPKSKINLVLLNSTKLSSYKLRFNSFSINRVEIFSFSMQ
jgi:ABC-type transport system involved in Fe-S cluster assembly fused permease/ATPase subunit